MQRGTLEYELRKPKGTSNSMILVPLFDLNFLRRTRGHTVQEFQIGGTRLDASISLAVLRHARLARSDRRPLARRSRARHHPDSCLGHDPLSAGLDRAVDRRCARLVDE